VTRGEILAMPAGPELDALVASKVMGWEPGVHGRGDGTTYPCGRWHLRDTLGPALNYSACGAPVRDLETCVDCGHEDPAWSPSTDAAAAMQTLAALEEQGWYWEAGVTPTRYECRLWLARTEKWRLAIAEARGEGETLPLAVCRAALLAVGGA
jgi:hypothetical protein